MNFDLHIHFSLKPANSKRTKDDDIPDKDHWNRRFLTRDNFDQPKIIKNAYAKVVYGSQSHGQSLKDGNCRIICNSLYPIEMGFIKTTFSKFVASLTGVDQSVLFDLAKMRLTYFQAMSSEYENLLSVHRKKSFTDDGGHVVLVNSFGEILKELGKSDDSILVMNSVEGAHAFFEYSKAQDITFKSILTAEKQLITGRKPRPNTKSLEKLIDGMERNIDRVKTEWKYPPFFVTFAHHYYNHLCGHSKSLSMEPVFQQQTLIWVQDGSKIINRLPDYVGFRPWGSKILFQLLSRKSTNGNPVRRILIDTKHMSIRARGQFLHTVKDRMHMFDDRIPIIQSHTTVNGRPSVIDTYERSGTAEDEVKTIRKERNKRDDISVLDQDPHYFDNGDLNLFDDEIKAIVESDGLMGLQLDEKRLLGKELPPECAAIAGVPAKGKDLKNKIEKFAKENLLEKIKEQHEDYWADGEVGPNPYELLGKQEQAEVSKYKEVFCCLLLRNIFRMVEVAGDQAWDHICIGSDFEGVINTLPGYSWSENMQELREDLLKVWHRNADHSVTSVSELYGSYVTKQRRKAMIDKIFIYNAMNFLKKYFHDDYLKWGNLPETGFVLSKDEMGEFKD